MSDSSLSHSNTKVTIETKRICEQCRRRKRICNAQLPCGQCIEASQHCVYSVVSDQSRSVFSTQAARRLSSGSACETCRRRKTKCDGQSPCNFCKNNNIECVNHSERRHLAKLNNDQLHQQNKPEAIERIEGRLRRIEKLMTAFSPIPNINNTSPDSHKVRPHRHSFQGIHSKEPSELNSSSYDIKRRGSPYSSSRYPSLSPPPQSNTSISLRPSNSHSNAAQSGLNSTISPSSSNTTHSPFPLMSTSSPSLSGIWPSNKEKNQLEFEQFLLERQQQKQQTHLLPSPPNSARSTSSLNTQDILNHEWAASNIPSVMDQLSKITFASTASNYNFTNYPIYPLASSLSHPCQSTTVQETE